MPSTPTSHERIDLEFGLLLDPAQHPGLTSRQITDRVMVAIGKEFGDIGITNVRTTPRSAAFGDRPAGPVPINPDWHTIKTDGRIGVVTGNAMKMTSGTAGPTRDTDDQRLLDAIALSHHYSKLGGLDDAKDKAASRHARHHQDAIKAVSGARQLLGSAIAEPLAEHVRALVGDVDKASSVAAGYASLVKSLLTELGATRRQAAALRTVRDTTAAAIRNTLPASRLPEGDSLPALVHAVCGAYAEKVYAERTLEEHLPQLLARPTTVEHEALFRRALFLEERIEAAIASGILRTTTGRGWMRRAAQAEEDHVTESAGTYASTWQRFWDDHRARTAEHLTPYGSLATLQIPFLGIGTDNTAGVDK